MYTEIMPHKLRAFLEELSGAENQIKNQIQDLYETISVLKMFDGDAMEELVRKLTKQAAALEQERIKVRTYRLTLEKIITLYEKCENQILSFDEGKKTSFPTDALLFNLHPYVRLIPNTWMWNVMVK
ncbi:MAG: hypothetical protein Q4B70_09640 [Lachnospiraceae bacterium]|nr:hypothetical protein [Lachnospiraceae bacterium]